MNIFALIACLVAVICYYAAIIAFDRIHQLQASKRKVQEAALDLLIECQLLRARNDWLEGRQRQICAATGGGMLHLPARVARLIKGEDKRMVVKTGEVAP